MSPDPAGTELAIDHVALPLKHADAMMAFYRSLGLAVEENPFLVQVHLGHQLINFHQPALWQGDFALRAPEAVPPCGDLCLVWPGTADTLAVALDRAGADIVEGPVERVGGRGVAASSVYVRDPDGNLLEFMIYPEPPDDTPTSVVVDREACMGSGNCVFWAPGLFDLDEDGIAVVVGDPTGRDEEVRQAAANCPTSAIRVDRPGLSSP